MSVPRKEELNGSWLRVYTSIFHLSWIAIVVLAAIQRFSIPAEPFIDRDIWGYLSPALVKLSGGAFVQSEGRSFVYPGFVYLTIAAFRNFGVITIIQHVLGIGAGLLILANWTTARRLLPRPFLPEAVHDLLGLGLLTIYLLSAQATFGEHHLRPEAFTPFFAVLGFYFTIRFLVAKYVEQHSQKTLLFGAASLATALLLPFLKPSYWLTTFLTTLPLWWHLFDHREKLARRLLTAGAPVLAAILLLGIPDHFYAAANPRGRVFLAQSLFTVHAPQIREQMARDVAAQRTDLAYPLEKIRAALALLDQELPLSIAGRHHAFAPLGFNPDYLLYEDSFCRKLVTVFADRDERGNFCQYYFRRTWHEQPGLMFRKVDSQLALFYNLHCPVYSSRVTPYQNRYVEGSTILSAEPYRSVVATFPPAESYVQAMTRLCNTKSFIGQPACFKAIMGFLSESYLLGFILFAATGAWLIWSSEDRARSWLFLSAPALGYAYNLGNNVAIAFFHTLGVGRYSHVQFATTLLVQFQTVLLLIEILGPKFTSVVSAGLRNLFSKSVRVI